MRGPRFLFACLLSSCAALLGGEALAQIIPDQTLGAESSTVVSDVEVRGDIAERIEGGATRGSNLFHSFGDFSVLDSQRVYFASPEGIESILSRVTGDNASSIFGTLGVDGAADLFLINPNGIVFGSDANLDVEGSFYATTAEAIAVGDGIFSATSPEQSQLLSVTPEASFLSYLTEDSSNIVNRGEISVGENFTLAADTLDLQGQISSGADLSLLAADAVQIRDTAGTPFVASAGHDLLVQGNEAVDIVVLSHPESGLFSYGEMVLRSAAPVGGDAHYWSGGGFRVETLEGDSGILNSPIDPIIRTLGDVAIGGYTGSSLHILAGGSVDIGFAIINASETGESGVDFLQETITLSDGTKVDIDSESQPTLDVRAGVDPEALGVPPLELITGFDTATDTIFGDGPSDELSRADITVGGILINPSEGLVLLTNQYQTNTLLEEGNITVTGPGIYTSSTTETSGSIMLDSRNSIQIENLTENLLTRIDASSSSGVGGNITLIANNDISLDGVFSGLETNLSGNVAITADNLRMNPFTFIFASKNDDGFGGSTTIQVNDSIVLDNAVIGSVALGSGFSGDVLIDSSKLQVDGRFAFISTRASNAGRGGDITIDVDQLTVSSGASILASTNTRSDAGDVTIIAQDFVEVVGTTFGLSGEIQSSILAQTENTGNARTGDAGNLNITASRLSIRDGAVVSSQSQNGASGRGGDIEIQAGNLSLSDGGLLTSATTGLGDSGNINLSIDDSLEISNAGISTTSEQSSGGKIAISARDIRLINDGDITTNVNVGQGGGGNITVQSDFIVVLDDSDILAFSSDGRGGEIDLSQTTLFSSSQTPTSNDPSQREIASDENRLNVLDGNGRVDINASGGIAPGEISINRTNLVENEITELPTNLVNPDTLVADSCIARSDNSEGNLTLTSRDRIPQSPNETTTPYTVGSVQPITEPTAITEPQAIYQLADGRLVMNRDCES